VPFQRELDAIVRDVPGVVGVILVDFEGEAVIGAVNGISNYDLKVVGAYGGIFRDQVRRLCRETGLGAPLTFMINGSEFRLLSEDLKDGYHLVLVANMSAKLTLATERIRECAEKLKLEL
jgi:predicted regulator of Ras-like GTPase activity (Roadblock/LC7/MglB family)